MPSPHISIHEVKERDPILMVNTSNPVMHEVQTVLFVHVAQYSEHKTHWFDAVSKYEPELHVKSVHTPLCKVYEAFTQLRHEEDEELVQEPQLGSQLEHINPFPKNPKLQTQEFPLY